MVFLGFLFKLIPLLSGFGIGLQISLSIKRLVFVVVVQLLALILGKLFQKGLAGANGVVVT